MFLIISPFGMKNTKYTALKMMWMSVDCVCALQYSANSQFFHVYKCSNHLANCGIPSRMRSIGAPY